MRTTQALTTSTVDAVVHLAIEAALDPEGWPVLLSRLAEETGAVGAMFAVCSFRDPEDGFIFVSRLDPQLTRRYLDNYQDNPLSRCMVGVRAGTVVDQRERVDERELRRSPFYSDVLVPQGVHTLVAMPIDLGAGYRGVGGIGLPYSSRGIAARARGTELLRVASPYLQRACGVSMRLRSHTHLDAALEGVLNAMPYAILVVDAAGKVLFANGKAEALVARNDGLDIVDGRIAPTSRSDSNRLGQLVREAAQPPGHGQLRGDGMCSISRVSGAAPYSVLVAPLPDVRDRLRLRSRPFAMLVVTDPAASERAADAAPERLQALYGLTSMEAKVAVAFGKGYGGPRVAQELDIAPSTVHSHLMQVFGKTGVQRQAELVRLLTRIGVLDIE